MVDRSHTRLYRTDELTQPGVGNLRPALLAGLVGVAAQVALTAPFMSRYGWDRDELYFLSAAHHPALGYVDFPPLTAWIGWVVNALAPHSLVALRAVSMAAGAATVLLVALIGRELGGSWRAQAGAALAWALTPYILGSASIFHPTWLDALAWAGFLYLLVRLLVRGEQRLWPLAGVVAGVGLEAKYTLVVLLAAVGIALFATPERSLLATRGPWLVLGVALMLLIPNLVWQAEHGWASVHFFASQNSKTASDTSRRAYVGEGLLFLGASGIVAAIGVVWLWRRGLRALALIPPIVNVLFLLERGRSYYPLPADVLVVAAGAVALERWLRPGRQLLLLAALAAVQMAVLVLAAPIVVPFYSTSHLVSSGVWKSGFFKDEIGWPELAQQVERAWRALPARERRDGVILAGNYGEASALDYYLHGGGLVLSGHLSWQYWRPARLPQRFALTVGYSKQRLRGLCRSWRTLARIDNRWQLGNEERGRLIAACRLKASLQSLWPRIATAQL